MSGGVGCGGAADYGVYVWGTNQTAGQGNVIQPAHNPAGVPPDNGSQQTTKGGSKRKMSGGIGGFGGAASTVSPALTNASSLLNPEKMSEISTTVGMNQANAMLQPVIPGNISSDSQTHAVAGGRRSRRKTNKKKISSKNKRHGRKRRTTKVR